MLRGFDFSRFQAAFREAALSHAIHRVDKRPSSFNSRSTQPSNGWSNCRFAESPMNRAKNQNCVR